jgi:Flp pilus assembly pilin Flp
MALYLQATVVSYVSTLLEKLHSDQRGQDTLEWTMITGLMAVALLVIAGIFTPALTAFANGVKNCVDFSSATTCVAGL